ncbi:hypothetical protein ASD54_12395 [Rhizobium sp. Root149]|nr:hypothetical protein ASD54_12395 [Rhizobium sp. Root149]
MTEWNAAANKPTPKTFKNPLIAELFAWREKHKREEAVMRRDGDTIGTIEAPTTQKALAKSQADKLFSKGRMINVQRIAGEA